MNPVVVQRGNSPLVLGVPHAGTEIPDDVREALNPNGLLLTDTDWHVDRLYDGLDDQATLVRATFHRYVVDANRDPENKSLYPGQNTTGLVPLTDFDGKPIWRREPDDAAIANRIDAFHTPYHAALRNELARVHNEHGVAILYDCHSIRSQIPFLFEGRLPDFNIGTFNGATCSSTIANAVLEICRSAAGYTTVLNGRFKGGWTTRHYGKPKAGIHAVQMELAQSTHLEKEQIPFVYSAQKASRLRPILGNILQTLIELAPSLRR